MGTVVRRKQDNYNESGGKSSRCLCRSRRRQPASHSVQLQY